MKEKETKTAGTLFGVGVGPGDPELMTLKSVRVLGAADVVFAAASTKNAHSLAVRIAAPHIPKTTRVALLRFPMTRDKAQTRKAWEENAATIIRDLEEGRNAVFLTLGDPSTYSTFGYILKHVKLAAPHIRVETVPGITSYQAAAACLNTPLVEGEESLLITSGVKGGDRLRALAEKPENIVFMKAYRNVGDISDALQEADLLEKSVGVANCGMPGQEIIPDIRSLSLKPADYWTLIIAKHGSQNGASGA